MQRAFRFRCVCVCVGDLSTSSRQIEAKLGLLFSNSQRKRFIVPGVHVLLPIDDGFDTQFRAEVTSVRDPPRVLPSARTSHFATAHTVYVLQEMFAHFRDRVMHPRVAYTNKHHSPKLVLCCFSPILIGALTR